MTLLFQTIQFSKSLQFSSITAIDKSLSGATTPGQSWPGSDGNKWVPKAPTLLELHHKIARCHIQNTHEGSYPFAEMQSLFSATPAEFVDMLKGIVWNKTFFFYI